VKLPREETKAYCEASKDLRKEEWEARSLEIERSHK
jgi:hypothetical protein